VKTAKGRQHVDRDAQFGYLNDRLWRTSGAFVHEMQSSENTDQRTVPGVGGHHGGHAKGQNSERTTDHWRVSRDAIAGDAEPGAVSALAVLSPHPGGLRVR